MARLAAGCVNREVQVPSADRSAFDFLALLFCFVGSLSISNDGKMTGLWREGSGRGGGMSVDVRALGGERWQGTGAVSVDGDIYRQGWR